MAARFRRLSRWGGLYSRLDVVGPVLSVAREFRDVDAGRLLQLLIDHQVLASTVSSQARREAAEATAFRTFQAAFQELSRLKESPSRKFASSPTRPSAPLKERPMNTSTKTRVTAFVAAAFVTFGAIDLIASYAYPEAPAVLIAAVAR